jgi:hypothetical protein
MRSMGYVFLAGDVYKLNEKINAGSPQITKDVFIDLISGIKLADDEEILACFDVTPKEEVCVPSCFFSSIHL